MNSNNSPTDARNSEKVAAEPCCHYDRLIWGEGDVEITGYVPTRRDLYLLARQHACDAIFLDAKMCLGGRYQHRIEDKHYAEDRIASIRALIGSPLTDKAIRDAVQQACRGSTGELWAEYRQMRLRWLPSPWGLGELNPPPDAWLQGGGEKRAADARGDSPTDQGDALAGPGYDEAIWGEGDVEITGYVPTRCDLYILAREHAGDSLHLDYLVHVGSYRRDMTGRIDYAAERLKRIVHLIGSLLTDKAIRDAVQLACRDGNGEHWQEYVEKRLRWLPSPWGLGEPNPPPDAWLNSPTGEGVPADDSEAPF